MSCVTCGKSHVLDTCEHFMKKTLKERTKLLVKSAVIPATSQCIRTAMPEIVHSD